MSEKKELLEELNRKIELQNKLINSLGRELECRDYLNIRNRKLFSPLMLTILEEIQDHLSILGEEMSEDFLKCYKESLKTMPIETVVNDLKIFFDIKNDIILMYKELSESSEDLSKENGVLKFIIKEKEEIVEEYKTINQKLKKELDTYKKKENKEEEFSFDDTPNSNNNEVEVSFDTKIEDITTKED